VSAREQAGLYRFLTTSLDQIPSDRGKSGLGSRTRPGIIELRKGGMAPSGCGHTGVVMKNQTTAKPNQSIVEMAKKYWPKSRRYYSDRTGCVGFPTGPLRTGFSIVWCRPGEQPGTWVETGSTLTPEGAQSIRF
jgi:hypothetical protein